MLVTNADAYDANIRIVKSFEKYLVVVVVVQLRSKYILE